MVLIGVDYGKKHIGVSVGDTVSKQAKPLVGFSYTGNKWIVHLREIIDRWQPEKVVVGLPLNADGSEQPLTKKVLCFVEAVNTEFKLPVDCVDERWSTVAAKTDLYAENKVKKIDKAMIDAHSAKLILEQWFLENA